MDRRTIDAYVRTGAFERETPQQLFDFLNDIFHFDIDLCASKKNKKVEKFFSLEKDSFKKKWRGNCWMNPPYGKPQNQCEPGCTKKTCTERGFHLDRYWPGIGDWLVRAHRQTKKYKGGNIVCLIPVRTATQWFNFVWRNSVAICFLHDRLKFDGSKSVALFPSAIAIFGKKLDMKVCERLSKIGAVVDKEHGLVVGPKRGKRDDREGTKQTP